MAVLALNLTGACISPQAIAKAFQVTIIEHPELPDDKLFFVDARGNVVAVIVNIGKDGNACQMTEQ